MQHVCKKSANTFQAAWFYASYAFTPKNFSLDAGIDHLLAEQAYAQKKPIAALESVEPLKTMQQIPEDVIQRSIDAMLAHAKANKAQTHKTWQLYHQNRAKDLMAYSESKEELKYTTAPQDEAFIFCRVLKGSLKIF
ncbi:Uncharacterised protein [Kingella negevensis]|uniref:Uncharacterized protein n=1 Tax=Kingella negevensis TaxID=1522312 RepID=A0A238HDF9_9NEIS|nr:Uncharacterised protein [Kingella negevensis]